MVFFLFKAYESTNLKREGKIGSLVLLKGWL